MGITGKPIRISGMYIYLYHEYQRDCVWWSTSLLQLCQLIRMEGKTKKQVYHKIHSIFRKEGKNHIDLEVGVLYKVARTYFIPGLPRGNKGATLLSSQNV